MLHWIIKQFLTVILCRNFEPFTTALTHLREFDVAEVALVGLLPGVLPGVKHQRVLLAEGPAADVALEGLRRKITNFYFDLGS